MEMVHGRNSLVGMKNRSKSFYEVEVEVEAEDV
jgi:hypothetical protein